ncbi:MAG: hypothetical protein R3C97_09775 [Geminicoccaceae bacterium]
MRRTDHRADDEEGQRDEHPHRPAADGEQGTRCTAATELHSDAENEGTNSHARSCRHDEATDALAKKLPGIESREEEKYGDSEHDHLCTKATPLACHDETTPGGRETEARMIENKAQCRTEQERRIPSVPR